MDSVSFSEDLDRLRQEVRRLSVQVEIAERECGEEAPALRFFVLAVSNCIKLQMLLRAGIKRIILTISDIISRDFQQAGRQTKSINIARTPWLWPQVHRWHRYIDARRH